MHMHKRLAGRFAAEVVPGVTSVSAAAAALGQPLVEGDEVLTVLPGHAGRRRSWPGGCAATDAAAVMKLGRTFPGVREALEAAGRLDEALLRRARHARAAAAASRGAADVDPATVPYFSLVLVPAERPGSRARARAAERPMTPPAARAGRVVVVGLGPAGRDWLTPQAPAVLAAADDLVGYATYLDRVPPNPRQRRHASDNRVEARAGRVRPRPGPARPPGRGRLVR